jgi:hypothetical protein
VKLAPFDTELTVADLIAQIQRASDAGEEVIEMCITVGSDAARTADVQRVVIGELARLLTVRYGEGTVETFAKGCGLKTVTVRSYRVVVRTFTFATAYRFTVEDGVPWVILRDAAHGFGGDTERAMAFVEDAADKRKTVIEAQRDLAIANGKPPKPRVLLNGYEADIVHINYERGTVTFLIGDGVQKLVDSDPEHVMLTVTEAVRVAAAAAGGGVAS